jgi:hypothetical protein
MICRLRLRRTEWGTDGPPLVKTCSAQPRPADAAHRGFFLLMDKPPMAEFVFEPPLRLKGRVTINSLSQAILYIRNCTDVRQPRTRESVLRIIESAASPEQHRLAAKTFRFWVEAEGLLLGGK